MKLYKRWRVKRRGRGEDLVWRFGMIVLCIRSSGSGVVSRAVMVLAIRGEIEAMSRKALREEEESGELGVWMFEIRRGKEEEEMNMWNSGSEEIEVAMSTAIEFKSFEIRASCLGDCRGGCLGSCRGRARGRARRRFSMRRLKPQWDERV